MLVIGVALLLGAAILAPLAVRALRRRLSRRDADDVCPRALAEQAGSDVSVSGVAVAGPQGPVESRLARTDCVWHGHEVLRHYWSLTEDSGSGERVRTRACDSIADYGGADILGLTGSVAAARRNRPPVLIDPEDAAFSGADLCLQRVVGRPQRGVPAPADDLLPRVKGRISGLFRGETIEFEYREWVLRPGDPITVHGRVELRDGRPVLTAPPDGRLRIERRRDDDDRERRPGSGAAALLLGGSTVVAACAGVLLVLAGTA
ncbi:GIDE domain-containing protein [Streptomonospora salina]|uniref:RING-type E3 ubiquitin transferase n=1 Tax=Streptomonospora salina TaxID=104205 RepID=A0A841E8A3_9ACTN|nr:GIDE domain-containing protein [Streptomonospora salina]MBB5999122.1 hypothetical protein [Streptomonospora salina]